MQRGPPYPLPAHLLFFKPTIQKACTIHHLILKTKLHFFMVSYPSLIFSYDFSSLRVSAWMVLACRQLPWAAWKFEMVLYMRDSDARRLHFACFPCKEALSLDARVNKIDKQETVVSSRQQGEKETHPIQS